MTFTSRRSLRLVAAGLLTLGSFAVPFVTAEGQSVPPFPKLTPVNQAIVIDTVVAQLGRIYVDADTGRLIGERLRRKLEVGTYRTLENPAQFAEAVTQDLRAVNHDLHLSLRYSPTPPSQSGGGPGISGARQLNFGLGRAEILDGNVGYLEITGFMGAPGYQEVVADALRFLSRTDAVIIDIRRNGGGSSDMSHFVFSHFLDSIPVPTIKVRRRSEAEPVIRYSLKDILGPRRPDVPLYVLTSQATGSAAEEFAFVLKNRHRAKIVGTRTAGAGHMVRFVPSGQGFVLGLSITRVSDPETELEWEQVGVQPDISVSPNLALAEAHSAALQAILAASPAEPQAGLLTRALAAVDARRRPQAVEPARLAAWAGLYEGRVVSLEDGRLTYARRQGGLKEELVSLGGNRFALGTTQFVFGQRDGAVTLTVDLPDGTTVTFARGPAPGS